MQAERTEYATAARRAPLRIARLQHVALHAIHPAAGHAQRGDAVPEPDLRAARRHGLVYTGDERRQHPRARAPRHVEARDAVARAGLGMTPSLGPADDGEEAESALVQPGALLARGEVDIGLGPAPRPFVFRPVEGRGPYPILPS